MPKPYPTGPPPAPPTPCALAPDKIIDGVSYYSQETVAKMFAATWKKINSDPHSELFQRIEGL